MRFILITNPVNGSLSGGGLVNLYGTLFDSDEMFPYDNYHPAFIVEEDTSVSEIENFIRTFPNLWLVAIYHGEPNDDEVTNILLTHDRFYHHAMIDGRTPRDFQANFKNHRRIMIRDNFNKETRNADYRPDEFFTDMNTESGNPDNIGWGDYSIVGDHYSDGPGGMAHSVAIHHVHRKVDRGDCLHVSHIVEIGGTTADVEGKAIRAMKGLVKGLDWMSPDDTESCAEWRELAEKEIYKGLGYLKKLSIKHHLETIMSYE